MTAQPTSASPLRASIAALLATLATVPLAAQTAPAASSPTATAQPAGQEAITLSTFTVREDQDIGYESTQTTAGMRTVQELKNVSNSISILNSAFLEDIGATTFEEMSQWIVSGESNPDPTGQVDSRVILRGIPNAYAMRNGWIWYSPMDAFSTERVEILRGPNAFLYGEADVGGAQNQITKRGLLSRDLTRVRFMAGSWDMLRGEIDINRRVIKDKLAVRVAAVKSYNESFTNNVERDFSGAYLAVTYTPFKSTKISVMAEHSEADQVNGQGLFVDRFSLATNTTIPVGDGYVYVPATGQRYRGQATGRVRSNGTAVAIVDPSIVPKDFHSAGPNSTFYNYLQSVSLEVEQRIGKNLVLQLSGNFYNRKIDVYTTAGVFNGGRAIYIDRNPTLPGGAANPYFGEYYTEYQRTRNVNGNIVRDMRLSAVYDLKTWLTNQSFMLNLQQHQDTPGQKKPKWGEYVDPSSTAWNGAQPVIATTQTQFTSNRTLFTNNRLMRRYYFNRDGLTGSEDMNAVPGLSGWFPDLAGTVPATGNIVKRRFYTPSVGVGASGSWFKEHLFTHLGYRQDKFNMKTTVGAVQPLRDQWVNDVLPGAFSPNPAFVNVKVDGSNAGAILRLNDAFAVGYNWAQSFRISASDGNDTYRIGQKQGIGVGEGEDMSARFSLFPDKAGRRRVEFNVTRYHNFRPNDRVANTSDVSVENEVAAIFPTTFLVSGADLQTTTTEGFEYELVANPTPNWRLSFNFATNKVFIENRNPILKSFQAEAKALNQPTPLLDSFLSTFPEGTPNAGYTKERSNIFTRYTFTRGPLRGLYVGGGLNYRLRTYRGAADLDGVAATPAVNLWSPAYTLYSVLAGYQTTIMKRRTSFALNLNNVFDKEYYRSTATASGSWGEPRSWRLTMITDF